MRMKISVAVVFLATTVVGCQGDDEGDKAEGQNPTPVVTATPTPTPVTGGQTTPTPSPSPVSGGGGGGGGSTSPTPSLQPTPTATVSPTAEPTPTPSITVGDASDCFQPELLATGTTMDLAYQFSDDDGQGTFRDIRTVNGPTQFNGQNATETESTTETTADGETYTSMTRAYAQVDAAAKTFFALGAIVESANQGFSVTTTNVIDPSREERFNLSAGDSHDLDYTTTTETSSPAFTTTATTVTDTTRTFDGIVSVTVPAGTFDACQFTELGTTATTVSGQTSTFDYELLTWFDVVSGVLVKEVSEGTTTELVQGTVNNTIVR